MIGPTGVGKTEIARRLAKLIKAPFCKVEATKYTEVGYHGRDVESVVRDLVESAFRMIKEQEQDRVIAEATKRANSKLVDLLYEAEPDEPQEEPTHKDADQEADWREEAKARRKRVRQRLRKMVESGELDDKVVTLKIEGRSSPFQVVAGTSIEQLDVDMQQMIERFMPKQGKSRELKVSQARQVLIEQEAEKLIDRDEVGEKAIRLAENSGIIFIDEIDKICGPSSSHGPDVSRQGVQRDLLPIVEGSSVQTRYGMIKTDYVLFIAAGAFHVSKPADLMPELQGRFPIRVELQDLTVDDFKRILKEPKNSLIHQTIEMLRTEGVTLSFTPEAIDALAEFAYQVNRSTQNIGARRLHTMLERLVEEISFDAPDAVKKTITIDAEMVRSRLGQITEDSDLSRFIL